MLKKQIDETFTAIINLQNTLSKEDYEWADKNWEEDETASEIVNLDQNLIDWGKEFR